MRLVEREGVGVGGQGEGGGEGKCETGGCRGGGG